MMLLLPAANLVESGVHQNIQLSYMPCNSSRLLYYEVLVHASPNPLCVKPQTKTKTRFLTSQRRKFTIVKSIMAWCMICKYKNNTTPTRWIVLQRCNGYKLGPLTLSMAGEKVDHVKRRKKRWKTRDRKYLTRNKKWKKIVTSGGKELI